MCMVSSYTGVLLNQTKIMIRNDLKEMHPNVGSPCCGLYLNNRGMYMTVVGTWLVCGRYMVGMWSVQYVVGKPDQLFHNYPKSL